MTNARVRARSDNATVRMDVLCGPAASGKVRLAMDRVIECCAAGDGAWLLVPTGADVVRAQVELADRAGIVIGARVATFHQLARDIAADPTAFDLPPAGESLIIGRLVRRAWPHGGDGEAAFAGWPASARRRIVELRAAEAVGAPELEHELAKLPPGEQDRWRELLMSYGRILGGRGLRDDAWFSRRALQRLQSAADASELGLIPIVAYGFEDFLTWQVRLLESAARLVPVTISLPFEPGRAVYERRQALVDRLVARGARLVGGGEAGFESEELAHVEQRMFEPAATPVLDLEGAVRFRDCCGPMQEAEEVVRAVAAAMLEGVKPSDIAVLTADPRPMRRLLEPAFRRAGIPITIEASRALGDTPAGRAVLDLLDAVIDDEPTAWFAFARSRISPIDADAVAAAELVVGERGSDAASRKAAGWWIGDAAVPDDIIELRASTRGPEAARMLCGVLGRCRQESIGDRRLLSALVDTVTRVEQASGERPPSLAELRDALREMPIAAPTRPYQGSVVVAPVSRVRTDRFDTVVLHGMHSGGFTTGADDVEAPLVARELGHTALTRARRRLTIVRQAAGSDGRELAPHPVWSELRRLLPDAASSMRSLDEVVPPPRDVILRSEVARSLALHDPRHRVEETTAWSNVDGMTWSSSVGAIDRIAVTSLEGYLACPARWFIERHLIATRRGRGQVVGTLVHDALARLVPRIAEGTLDREEVDEDVVGRAVDAASADMRDAAAVRDVDRASARLLAMRLLRHDQPFGERVLVEQSCGRDGDSIAPIDIDGVRVVGRIDRLDIAEDGAVVIHDYKLGRLAKGATSFVSEGRLQLPLYWEAVASTPGMHPVAALYRPLRGDRPRGIIDKVDAPAVDGEFRTDRLAPDVIESIVDAARAEAAAAIEGIRAGAVPAAPRGGTCPDWCRLQRICRVGEVER